MKQQFHGKIHRSISSAAGLYSRTEKGIDCPTEPIPDPVSKAQTSEVRPQVQLSRLYNDLKAALEVAHFYFSIYNIQEKQCSQ